MVSATRGNQVATYTSNRTAFVGIRWDFGGDTIIVSYIPIFKALRCHLLTALCLMTLLIEHKQTHPPHTRSSVRNGVALVSYANTCQQLSDRSRIQGMLSELVHYYAHVLTALGLSRSMAKGIPFSVMAWRCGWQRTEHRQVQCSAVWITSLVLLFSSIRESMVDQIDQGSWLISLIIILY
jgi:hypothetical protein